MDDLSFFIAVIGWGLLPGLALLYALDVDWSLVERAAGAAGLSLALGAVAAYTAEAIGRPITPAPVLAVIVAVCILAATGRRLFGRGENHVPSAFPEPRPGWVPWLVWLLPIVVIYQLEPVSSVPLLPPTLHDGLDHANWFRLIYEIHSLDPRVVAAPPLAPDGSPSYYPWGLHAWTALVAQSTTLDPVAALSRCFVLISAAMPLSVYVFAAWFVGRGWPAMAAAAFSLLFWWLPYQVWGWGGYPLLAGALAALPISRLAVSVVTRRSAIGVVAAAVCALGLLAIHPSQAFLALVITVVVSCTLAASRVLPWWTTVPFLLMLGTTALAFAYASASWPPLESFLDRARGVGATLAGDPRYRWPVRMYFDNEVQLPAARQIGLGVLSVLGALYALMNRHARPVLILHLVFSLLIPLAVYQTWLTSLWYHTPERIWYAQYAILPVLAALGVAGVLWALARFLPRLDSLGWLRPGGWVNLAWPLVLVAVFGVVYPAYATWGALRLFLFAQRNQQLTLTDRRVLADFEWIHQNVPRGEVLFNAPADWGISLPFTGHRTVFWSGGAAFDAALNWGALVSMLRRGGAYAAHAAQDLSLMRIRYLYAGVLDPRLSRNGRARLDGQALEGVPGFEMLYRSPTARVFRIVGERHTELLGLNDSERVRFEGFHVRERLGRITWRWTNGASHLRIKTTGIEGHECFVRIFGPSPGAYQLELGGAALEFTVRGHRIPPSATGADVIELVMRSEASVPAETGRGPDDRLLGLKVRDIALSCTPQ
jgi:hypothetical protein